MKEIDWFGSKSKEGFDIVKTSGKAITAAVGLTLFGVALGAFSKVNWGK